MSKSLNLNQVQAEMIINHYKEYSVPLTNNYTLFRAKYKSSALTIFKTLKLLIQGGNDNDRYLDICTLLNIVPEITLEKNSTLAINLSLIGTDEVGTGDFFGGIVVVGAFVEKEQISELKKLGVKDSKELTDEKIMEIAPILIKNVKYSAHLLENMKFNYITKVQKYNMNKIKALLHNSVIRHLQAKVGSYDGIVIDAFTTIDKYFDYLKDEKNVATDVNLIEKAESKYISVAAASIIARYVFLEHLIKLSQEVGFELPKGAGPRVDVAIQKIIKTKSVKFFDTIAKTNFKNFEKYR